MTVFHSLKQVSLLLAPYMTLKPNFCCTEDYKWTQLLKTKRTGWREVFGNRGHFTSGQETEASRNRPELSSVSSEKAKGRQTGELPSDREEDAKLGSACILGVSHLKCGLRTKESKHGALWTLTAKMRLCFTKTQLSE